MKYLRLLTFLILSVYLYSCATVQESEDSIFPALVEPSELVDIEIPDPIDLYISTMSIEEKIGQLIIINVRDSDGLPYLHINDDLIQRIARIRPGGVLLFGGSIQTIPQTTSFIENLQASSLTPLFIAVDVEGGMINRLRSSEAMHATALPANGLIGLSGDLEKAAAKAGIIGRELFALGINMNFAPVADVLTHPENTVIASRSFGSDPELVAQMVDASVRSMRKEKVATTIKHFPGHGDTISDSHLGTVSIEHDLQRLQDIEFIPFRSGISAGTDAVMTAHIQAPAVTGNDLPATLSHKMITEILRGDLGFDGLVITDSMGMGAITKVWDAGDAAVLAINAGVDLLLNPYTADEAYEGLLDAFAEGIIPVEQIDAAVYRILSSKLELGIMDVNGAYIYHQDIHPDPEDVLGSPSHMEIARKLFEK
jgi:beta-N-acetylhexosaminidase